MCCLGERRIRVHTICLPVSPNLHDVINGADQQAIVSLLAKMGEYITPKPILPTLSKVFERAAVDQLMKYLEENCCAKTNMHTGSHTQL